MWCCVSMIVQVPLHHRHQSRCLSIHHQSLAIRVQSHVIPQSHKPSTNNAFSVLFLFNTSSTTLAPSSPIPFPVCCAQPPHDCQSLKHAHTKAPHHQCPALSVLCCPSKHHTTHSHHEHQSCFLFPYPHTSQSMPRASTSINEGFDKERGSTP